MSNKALLSTIIVILLGIFTVLAFNTQNKSPLEQFTQDVADAGQEAQEEILDEIDDHSTAR